MHHIKMLFVFKLTPSKREFMFVLFFVLSVQNVVKRICTQNGNKHQCGKYLREKGCSFKKQKNKLYCGLKTLLAVSHDL